MRDALIYPCGITQAVGFAASHLPLPTVYHPTPDATHLLLDIPLRQTQEELLRILERLPENITVIGGRLSIPELATYPCIDLLQDEEYLAQNASITAHCAMKLALENIQITMDRCPVLILGWGRIGKCLAALLKAMGAEVTVAARKATDRAMLDALHYHSVPIPSCNADLSMYRLIYNTIPQKILSKGCMFGKGCLPVELSSQLCLPGPDVIDGRGLPGKLAAESSGRLIAQTIMRRI